MLNKIVSLGTPPETSRLVGWLGYDHVLERVHRLEEDLGQANSQIEAQNQEIAWLRQELAISQQSVTNLTAAVQSCFPPAQAYMGMGPPPRYYFNPPGYFPPPGQAPY